VTQSSKTIIQTTLSFHSPLMVYGNAKGKGKNSRVLILIRF